MELEEEETNKIVEVKKGNDTYKTWTVKHIKPFIIKYLKDRYPSSLVCSEINQIDITVFDKQTNDIIPVEIQKSSIHSDKTNENSKSFVHTEFEQRIRKQLEDNIENFGICWLFFDSEYLRYLQCGDVKKNTSIDLTWLVELLRTDTLKVFSIRYDSTVKELNTKDFDFLKNISQLCAIGYDNDTRELARNKLKIYRNVINGYKFTQEEITQFENDFDKRQDKAIRHSSHFYLDNKNERCKLYGNILKCIGALPSVNNILSCNTDKLFTSYAVILGLFYQNEYKGNNSNSRIQFIDKFGISQYFPGYIRNKQLWDYCKEKKRIFTISEFGGIVNGTYNYELIKQQSTLDNY